MKKLFVAASMLFLFAGIGFAGTGKVHPQQTPVKTESAKKDQAAAHHHTKKAKGVKTKDKSKEPKQG